jgi:methylenetetrahydrofolate dehydrogenase (NADP+) / methenyltetrahydrofolate cyclohydrolase
MTARIIDGTAISNVIRQEISAGVAELREQGTVPGLTAILIGADPASEVYVRRKTEACGRVGICARTINLPTDTDPVELFGVIDGLNADPNVHGILVQLPLPDHLNSKSVLARVSPQKDVDGFHPLNAGYAFVGDPRAFLPATPAGIMEILRREQVPTRSRHVVIVGRSLIVSKPLASLLMAPGPDATVTLTHKWTPDLASHTRMADILVVSVGKPGLITADMVKPGATVIDVGINRIDAGGGTRLVGDVDFDAVREVAGAITPVPGGVGPMTLTMLLVNTVEAARRAERRARRKRSRR